MTVDRSTRYGAATGIAFVALVLVAFVTRPGEPAPDAPANELLSFYIDERGAIRR